ncbi:zf-HC2 domain-containing protein [Actinosynnema sp. NPDC020468]|uniref:zf-HC2 domain-containing protein n=1 Tax=Actinosynnema sp. NPDC020468 TaxID=3154488 RepID=UPI0033F00936
MDCETCREALSARLDAESEPVPAADTDAHLEGCPSCRAWQDSAAALTRSLRLRPATATPDLVDAVLAAAPPPPRRRTGWYPRLGLGAVGVAQVTLGLGQLFGSSTSPDATSGHGLHGASSGHLFNESTAWNLALGLGLLWAALWPRGTSGLLPVTAAFVAVLTPYSVGDLVSGQATVQRVTSHAILLLGLALLITVHRGRRDPDGHRAPAPTPTVDLTSTTELTPPSSTPRRTRLRPVSRKAA